MKWGGGGEGKPKEGMGRGLMEGNWGRENQGGEMKVFYGFNTTRCSKLILGGVGVFINTILWRGSLLELWEINGNK